MEQCVLQSLTKALNSSFSHWHFQEDKSDDWGFVLHQSALASSEYLTNTIEYHLSYLGNAVNCSVVIYSNGKAFAIWPLTLVKRGNSYSLQSNCKNIISPAVSSNVKTKQLKKLYQQCMLFVEHLSKALNLTPKLSFDPIADALWQRTFAPFITSASYQQILLADLSVPLSELKQSFRKSYRSLINKGLKLWQVGVSTSLSDSELEEFRQFHIETAGKETRSVQTWQLQQKMVNEQEAFYVWLRDDSHRLIGAGLFNLSPLQASYSVGVYDRDMFDQPLGHVVQITAIEYMQAIGIKRYYLGNRHHSFEIPTPTQKEASIGFFKEGFSNQTSIEVNATITFE